MARTPEIDLREDYGRNYIINGGMDIWQRGTTRTTSAAGYTCDRFKAFRGGALGNITVSRQNNSTSDSNLPYFARIQRPNGDSNTGAVDANGSMFFGTVLETLHAKDLAGKRVTLSFKIRRSATSNSNNMKVVVDSGTGTDEPGFGSAPFTGTSSLVSTIETISGIGTDWVQYSYTFDVDSAATQLQFYVTFDTNGTAGTSDYIDIQEVMLTEGSEVLPFRKAGRSIEGELSLCQRYFYKIPSGGSVIYGTRYGGASGNFWNFRGYMPVEMRAIPSFENVSGAIKEGSAIAPTANRFNFLSQDSGSWNAENQVGAVSGEVLGNGWRLDVEVGANSGTAGVLHALQISSSAIMGFSAEL